MCHAVRMSIALALPLLLLSGFLWLRPPAAAARGATGVLYDEVFLKHRDPTGDQHPENPGRIGSIWEAIRGRAFARVPARRASDEELGALHSAAHVRGLELAAAGRGVEVETEITGDVFLARESVHVARLAAGGLMDLSRQVASGRLANGLAIIRPPGHHAKHAKAEGFCLFNNVALSARMLVDDPLLDVERVMIVDWDVHHGNGIQDLMWEDPRVLYVSLHRLSEGFYPGSGRVTETGGDSAPGLNVNIAFEEGGVGDAGYLAAFESIVLPLGRAFAPDIILVSAGFDAAEGDPLGDMALSPAGFAAMARHLVELGDGRVVMALEGGYNHEVTATCVASVLSVLLGERSSPARGGERAGAAAREAISNTRREMQKFARWRDVLQPQETRPSKHHHHHNYRRDASGGDEG